MPVTLFLFNVGSYNGYWVFRLGVKWSGHGVDPLPAETLRMGWCYTSTPSLCLHRHVIERPLMLVLNIATILLLGMHQLKMLSTEVLVYLGKISFAS